MTTNDAYPFSYPMNDDFPYLVISSPQCSHCGESVDIEEGWASCGNCLVSWDGIDEDAEGSPFDEDSKVCRAEAIDTNQSDYDHDGKHWAFGKRSPCILPAGHSSEHINPYTVTVSRVE